MKLRIKGDSIRLRLSRTEVQSLLDEGEVSETTRFPTGVFSYRLLRADVDAASAALEGHRVSVVLPDRQAREWCQSEQVSIRGEQALSDGALSLLVEKDFQCLTRRDDEDETDLYPHPEADQATC